MHDIELCQNVKGKGTETPLMYFIVLFSMYDFLSLTTIGFGFLTFENEDAVNKVCREHYVTFNGKKVIYALEHFIYNFMC